MRDLSEFVLAWEGRLMFSEKLAEACARKVPEPPNCGSKCNHPSGTCSGVCDECLREVHYETSGDKRADYDCKNLAYAYVRDFSERYKENMLTLLKDINKNEYPHYNIFSIGCGAAPDLAAFETIAAGKSIFYLGYDKNPL